MPTEMTAVKYAKNITHALLIELTLDDTTYYISNAYKPITEGNVTYSSLGAFLGLSNITEDLKTTNGDVQITLTGIPTSDNYLSTILTAPIKGGTVKIYRAFFDNYEIIAGQKYLRYQGIITNFAIDETENFINGELNSSISVVCASLNNLLENKVVGQRTNGSDRRKYYPGDVSFDRVKDLQNTQFDFGRKSTEAGVVYIGSVPVRFPVQK